MKTTILSLVAALSITATAATADDFDNNTYGINVTSGAMDFAIDGNEDSITELETGLTSFGYTTGAYEGEVRTALAYNLNDDTIGVRGEYNAAYDLFNNLTVYGTAAVDYTTLESDLGNGDFFFDPSAGVNYIINNTVSVFGEVGYTWALTDDHVGADFTDSGYVEAGVPLAINSTVTVTPSIVREFDTAEDETNVNLNLTLNF